MKRMLTMATTVCLALFGSVQHGLAQDEDVPPPGPPPGRRVPWQERAQEGPQGRRRLGGEQRGEPGQRLEGMQKLIEELRQQNPERFDELMQLRQTDRQAFAREVQKLAQEAGLGFGRRGPEGGPPEIGPEEERCRDLAKQYRDADDPARKERIKGELKEAVEAAFGKRLEQQRQRLAKMEEQIEQIRESLAEREKNKDKICATRLEELTRDPALHWDPMVR